MDKFSRGFPCNDIHGPLIWELHHILYLALALSRLRVEKEGRRSILKYKDFREEKILTTAVV